MTQDERITLVTDDGETVEFYVLEETKINGMNYLMVTDTEDEEAEVECYILKDRSKAEDAEAIYEFVEDGEELDCLFRIFTELLENAEAELQK